MFKLSQSSIVLYSQTKGVKQKYILCISGLVVYRQYIHSGSDPQIHNWLASGESILLLSPSAPDIPDSGGIPWTAPTAAGGC